MEGLAGDARTHANERLRIYPSFRIDRSQLQVVSFCESSFLRISFPWNIVWNFEAQKNPGYLSAAGVFVMQEIGA
jgi:hypothetical protein